LLVGGTAIEMIGAKVFVHRPILEHVVDGGQDGGEDGHDRLLWAAPGSDAVELSLQVAVFFFTAAQAHCTSVVLSQVPPLRRRLDRRLPALSSLRGHMQAHEMRCASEGNRLMSIPISETMRERRGS
jgi:hypothetical protein